jgi:hypothetical protein
MKTHQHLRTSLIVCILFLCAWLPRVLALDTFVTPDEPKWLARSANFYKALAEHDAVNTFQREHPGVTVMWAGALGMLQALPAYDRLAPGYFDSGNPGFADWLKANTSLTPLELLVAERRWIVFMLALLTAVAFLPLRRLLGEAPAIVAVLFVAWMPWNIALSRFLHPDGLLSSLCLLALAYFLAWLYGGGRARDLVMSGVIMGLAWLTKTPAALLVPTGAILVATELWATRHRSRTGAASVKPGYSWKLLLTGYVAWGCVATATFVVLWPAMWVHPTETLAAIAAEMNVYVGGHRNRNFFVGQIVDDPGVLFYPVAYYFRSTPASIIGLVAATVAAFRQRGPFGQQPVRQTAFGMIVFALVFLVGMTIPAKKFDRYLLPAFLALDVVAALGWVFIAGAAAAWFARIRGAQYLALRQLRIVFALVLVVALVPLHAYLALVNFPYYLTYYSPLAGGSSVAQRVMLLGWGEGLDQAAAWLNQQPDATNKRALSAYSNGPFSYFFAGESLDVSGSALQLGDADYVVLYANEIQRRSQPQSIAYLLDQPPAHIVTLGGLELARVYDMNAILQAHTKRARALDEVPIAVAWPDMRIDELRTWPDVKIGDVLLVNMKLSGQLDGRKLSVRLVDAANNKIVQKDLAPAAEMELALLIPPEAAAGDYQLQLVAYDAETQEVFSDSNGQDTTQVATIRVANSD